MKPPEKLTNYALNPKHKGGGKEKAISFERALRYNIDNYQDLIEKKKKNFHGIPLFLREATNMATNMRWL